MSADVHGKFLWHELMTHDPKAAAPFYAKVFGWTAQPWDKNPAYTVWMSGHTAAGGAMGLEGGGPPQWLAYIGVRDLDGTVAHAQRLGGTVSKGASEIPGTGARYAVLRDPQGGTFGVYTPGAASEESTERPFSWHELVSSDHSAAFRFYHELFGWDRVASHDMEAMGEYLIFGSGSEQVGGMYTRGAQSGGSGSQWLLYARVGDAAAAAEAARAAGGKVLVGPMQVPGGSWVAQLTDPQGAAIAVNAAHGAAPAAKPARPRPPRASAAAPSPPERAGAASGASTSGAAAGSGAAGKAAAAPSAKAPAGARAKAKGAARAKRKAKSAPRKAKSAPRKAKSAARRRAKSAPKRKTKSAARRKAKSAPRRKSGRKTARKAKRAARRHR